MRGITQLSGDFVGRCGCRDNLFQVMRKEKVGLKNVRALSPA